MILELKSLREEMHVHFEDLLYFDLGKHSTIGDKKPGR